MAIRRKLRNQFQRRVPPSPALDVWCHVHRLQIETPIKAANRKCRTYRATMLRNPETTVRLIALILPFAKWQGLPLA